MWVLKPMQLINIDQGMIKFLLAEFSIRGNHLVLQQLSGDLDMWTELLKVEVVRSYGCASFFENLHKILRICAIFFTFKSETGKISTF